MVLYGNWHRLSTISLKHSESMAIWTWFIPINVFFRPLRIMNEIWIEKQNLIKKLDSSYVVSDGEY